jgi:hypothetical protein
MSKRSTNIHVMRLFETFDIRQPGRAALGGTHQHKKLKFHPDAAENSFTYQYYLSEAGHSAQKKRLVRNMLLLFGLFCFRRQLNLKEIFNGDGTIEAGPS